MCYNTGIVKAYAKEKVLLGRANLIFLEEIMNQILALTGAQIGQFVLGFVLIALAVAIVILVLMQSGKEKGLSGTITGGSSDTFFSKNGGKSKDKLLSTITVIASIIMVVLTVAMTIWVSAS